MKENKNIHVIYHLKKYLQLQKEKLVAIQWRNWTIP